MDKDVANKLLSAVDSYIKAVLTHHTLIERQDILYVRENRLVEKSYQEVRSNKDNLLKNLEEI